MNNRGFLEVPEHEVDEFDAKTPLPPDTPPEDAMLKPVITMQSLVRRFLAKKKAEGLSTKYDSPYVPSSDETIEMLLEMTEITSDDTVVDLGCGDARVLIHLCQATGCRGIGVEIDPELIAQAQERIAAVSPLRIDIIECSIFDDSIPRLLHEEATLVWLYQLPEVCTRLLPIFSSLPNSSLRVASNTFQMPGWTPQAERFAAQPPHVGLFLYRLSAAPNSDGGPCGVGAHRR